MRIKEDMIKYCLSYEDVYLDYPFDDNWAAIRHKDSNRCFAFIYDRDGKVWMNLKADPEWRDFYRNVYESVVPAYHMNKTYWNSVILDGTVPESKIKDMISDSYSITKGV